MSGHEVDIRGEGSNCQNNALDHPFERFSRSFWTPVWAYKAVLFTGEKLAFKFSAYMFEHQPLPPTSTFRPLT